MHLSRESAETTALQALSWLAANQELMPVFLGATGASIEDVKANAGDAAFLGSVLDFIMMDDAWVLEFAASSTLPPERVMQARMALPGGEQVNWT